MDDKQYIYDSLRDKGITINPQYESVFSSHVDVLIKRLKNNECVHYEDRSFLEQIPNECIEIAREILNPLFGKYNDEVNETEIGLFAIYIKLSTEKED